jgi:hypothetical protein
MGSKPGGYWKLVLGVSVIVLLYSLISLPTLYENISGDSIPNRPQKEPPIEYQWDAAYLRIGVAIISLAVSIYSFNKIRII